jgi:hypothetical protein
MQPLAVKGHNIQTLAVKRPSTQHLAVKGRTIRIQHLAVKRPSIFFVGYRGGGPPPADHTRNSQVLQGGLRQSLTDERRPTPLFQEVPAPGPQ